MTGTKRCGCNIADAIQYHSMSFTVITQKQKGLQQQNIHTPCANTSSHYKFAVQVDTVTINLQYQHAPVMDLIGGVGVPPSPPPPYCDEASQYASQKNPVSTFGCHNIFRKAVFPLGPIVFFVTCHNSLPPPPPTPTP